MVEQWFEQNQIAIESGLKLEIFESFMGGMKQLFKECYIEIPEEKTDAFAQLEEKVQSLQEQLNESVEHRIALKTELQQLKKAEVVNEAVKGLTDLDAERLKSLAEDVVYESQQAFAKKLDVIKESFFANTAKNAVKAVVTDSPVIEEEVKPSTEKTELSESVQHFVKALDLLSIK
jgi:transcriptional regulator of NAD metabolism